MRIKRRPLKVDFVDLFAGPGGVTMGGELLGLTDLGIEWDAAACETRRAAGHPTLQADVRDCEPTNPPYFGVPGLWASPPCQGFSKAGLQKGLGDAKRILEHLDACRMGWFEPAITEWDDDKSELVLEPLRWVDGMDPEWTVWEQVPFVQPIWDLAAEVLQGWGYYTWTGKVSAEQYGVPQVRERAILIASKTHPVGRPAPTHSKYHARSPERIDEGLPRPVTMAEALGWGMTQRPYPVVAPGSASGGTDPLALGGSGARKIVYGAEASGDWVPQVLEPVDGLPRIADQTGTAVDLLWPAKRPSTVLPGRAMVQHPGATANRFNGATKSRNDGFRLTAEEGGLLQSFPRGYPWRGSKGKMWEQIGNVVPVLLAKACLAEAIGV